MTDHCAHHEHNTIRIATVEKGMTVIEDDVRALFVYKENHGEQLEQIRSDVQALQLIMEAGFKEQTKQICGIKNDIMRLITDRIADGDRAIKESQEDRAEIRKQLKILNETKWLAEGVTKIRDNGFWWIAKLIMYVIAVIAIINMFNEKCWEAILKVLK